MSVLLEIAGLFAGYAGVPVVRDLNLTVSEGEVVALLGPNGAGKTTTLMTSVALIPVIKGNVSVFGRSVKGRKTHHLARGGASMVPEDRALFSSLTVQENLRLAAKGNESLDRVFRYFPALEALMDRRAGLLSGGEQQMLAVGRALMTSPKLLIVDEMSLGLAPIIVQGMLPILPTIAAETGCGVLLVEQHVQQALRIAQRAYVLNHGDLVLEGSAQQLLDDPALLEASYLGTQNRENGAHAKPRSL
jgi:branched-chain amino acid transport system ATP-binding protein